ncbi:outer membrane beta-barrel protein [Novosphingobium sp. ZN18A2]|uniref:outer membrane beta-barrel protein n=1 Tax=Novosphingobium sp. ZN18A2 TaxID=3079861 RepID=UPI0030D39CAE
MARRLLLIGAAGLVSGTARAQDAQPANPAPDVSHDAPPRDASAHKLNADVAIAFGVDDNLFATKNGKVSDRFLLVQPALTLDLGGTAGGVTVRGSGEFARYRDHPSEDYDDAMLATDGRLRLTTGIQTIAGGSYAWSHESRTSPESEAGTEPTRFRRDYGYLGLVGKGGAWAYRIGATTTGLDFSDTPASAGTIDNADRNRRQFELGARVGYTLTRGPELFVQGQWDKRDYRRPVDDWGYRRNSEGFSVAAGVHQKVSARLDGEIFVGVLRQDYADPRLPDVNTIDYGALVNWTGSGVSASFKLGRSVEETTLPGASSYMLTDGTLSVRADAGRKLAFGGSLSGTSYDYRGADRSEFVIGANVWARYWFERNLFAGIDYGLAQRASNAAGYDYDRNRVFVTIGAQLSPRYGKSDASASAVRSGGIGGFYFATELGHGVLTTGLDGPRGTGTNTADFGGQGAEIGVALGYGQAVGRVYLGAEVSAFGGGPDWQHGGDRTFSVERSRAVDAAIRLGVLTSGKDIIYGRFGPSWTTYRTRYDYAGGSSDTQTTRIGLGAALGLEAAVGRYGFVRTEYGLVSTNDYDVVSGDGKVDNFSNAESRFRVAVGVRFAGNPIRDDAPADFSGFYAGVNLGHGALTSLNRGPRSGGFVLDATRSGQGGLLGVFAGAGLLAGRLYAGAELHAEVAHLDWNIERDPQGRIYSMARDHSYGASALLGVSVNPTALAYARIGAVRTQFDTHYSTSGTSVRDITTRTGIRYGGGLQFALGGSARLRLEYTVARYPGYAIAYGVSADTFRNYENTASIGFSWKI